MHVICERIVSCPPPKNEIKGRGHDRRLVNATFLCPLLRYIANYRYGTILLNGLVLKHCLAINLWSEVLSHTFAYAKSFAVFNGTVTLIHFF